MTLSIIPKIDNPYWEVVKDYVFEDRRPWGVEMQVDPFRLPDGSYRTDLRNRRDELEFVSRHENVRKYSWTITDPASVAFVAQWCQDQKVLDPLAGTGYWAYLLRQYGIDIVCSDADPFNNSWHRGAKLHSKIVQQDAVDAMRFHRDRILLLSWIPYGSPIGTDLLNQYTGNRIVYIGENECGCCADDDFFAKLEIGWDEVASHRPIQWFGMHDWITIYERKAITA